MNFFNPKAFALALTFAGAVNAQTIVTADITANTTWTPAGNPYILDGYIFVRDGATLTIQPGVIVRGLDNNAANNILPGGQNLGAISNVEERVGALIVSRTGFINAQGTAAQPIIFTAVKDDLNSTTDLTCDSIGLWGGLILLGEATVSSPAANFNGSFVENTIEGIVTLNPTTALLSKFGGTNDNDNSGILRYISIRHGGDILSDGNEVNGLTLGGVGRGTIIEFVEVLANADDGIEYFGGTVDTKYAVVTCADDDGFDYDQGFRGRGQFWIAISVGKGNRLGEWDGGDLPATATPFSTPVIFNLTFIGKPATFGTENQITEIRDNAGGNVKNSVFFRSPFGQRIEYRHDIISSYLNFSTNISGLPVGTIQALDLSNNTYSNITGNAIRLNEVATGFTGATQQVRSVSNANTTLTRLSTGVVGNNVVVANVLTVNGSSFDLRPVGAGTVLANEPAGGFFDNVSFAGAVDPASPTGAGWLAGWTATAAYGIVQ